MTKRPYRFGAEYKPQRRKVRQPRLSKKLHAREILHNQRCFWEQPIDPVLVLDPFHAALYTALSNPIQMFSYELK